MGFKIQQKSIMHDIWVTPTRQHDWYSLPVTADQVSVLNDSVLEYANQRTLDFATHIRIVTEDGAPVSRFKVWPGRVRQLRRRY